jgi:hypothetical protein
MVLAPVTRPVEFACVRAAVAEPALRFGRNEVAGGITRIATVLYLGSGRRGLVACTLRSCVWPRQTQS